MDSNHEAPRKVSRRIVLGTAAGAGAAGAAAAIGITKLTGDDTDTSDTSQTTATAAYADGYVPEDMTDSPAVFFVERGNAQMRVYYGANEVLLHDPELAANLWQRAQKS
jgi:hypothetical protein